MSARRPRPSARHTVSNAPTETSATVWVALGIVRRRPAAGTGESAPCPSLADHRPVATREALLAAILGRREFDPAVLEMLWALLPVAAGEG